MPEGRRDIESRADCERLVRAFYGRALEDPIIGFIFVDVAKLDLEAHVPRITSFWETILLGARSYGGGAFRPHAELHAKVGCARGTSTQWLHLWSGTVDELFAGERAELAKAHARPGRAGVPPPPPEPAVRTGRCRAGRPDRDAARPAPLSRLPDHAVAQVRDEAGAADRLERLEGEVADAVEQPLAGAQHHRHEVQPQLVDEPGREVLARDRGAAGERDVRLARGLRA